MNLPDPDRQVPDWRDTRYAEVDLTSGWATLLDAASILVAAFRETHPQARATVQGGRLVIWTRLSPEAITEADAAREAMIAKVGRV